MAPPFKRKRQASCTSSTARSSQRRGSQGGRSTRPSAPSHPFPQRKPTDYTRRQAANNLLTPRNATPSQEQPHNVVRNEEANEDLDQVVMAIDRQQKGTIGCAYYVAREEKLYCLQDVINGNPDTIETCEFRMLRVTALAWLTPSVKLDVRPTMILLSPRVDPDDNELAANRRLRRSSLVDDGVSWSRPDQTKIDLDDNRRRASITLPI